MFYRHGFYEQSYSKIRATTSSTVLYTLNWFKRRSTYPILTVRTYREYYTPPTWWNTYSSDDCGHRGNVS
jgi:hypothetical protein